MYYNQKESGYRIQKLRVERGMTQEELAERLNLSASMMSKIEQGNKGVSIDFLIEIATFFKVSINYLLLGQEVTEEELMKKLIDVQEEFNEIQTQLGDVQEKLIAVTTLLQNYHRE